MSKTEVGKNDVHSYVKMNEKKKVTHETLFNSGQRVSFRLQASFFLGIFLPIWLNEVKFRCLPALLIYVFDFLCLCLSSFLYLFIYPSCVPNNLHPFIYLFIYIYFSITYTHTHTALHQSSHLFHLAAFIDPPVGSLSGIIISSNHAREHVSLPPLKAYLNLVHRISTAAATLRQPFFPPKLC